MQVPCLEPLMRASSQYVFIVIRMTL